MDYAQTSEKEKLDCEGFFADIGFWSADVAENLAKANDIGEVRLSDNHWKVINYVKDYYKMYNTGPSMVKVIKNTQLSLQEICGLFPCGLVKGAYRLAGLPRPPGCI